MLVSTDERVPMARLLTFLELGERLARDCALAQATLVSEPKMRRFFLQQARQETFHAVVFQGAVAWLAPRQVGRSPFLEPLECYRRYIEEAIARKDLVETLLAEQVVMEGLGRAILERIEAGLVRREASFGRLRRILLHQEEAHHEFGERSLRRAVERGETSLESLRTLAPKYVALTQAMLTQVCDLFETIDEDPAAYLSDAGACLPEWLTPPGEGHEARGEWFASCH